MRHPADMAARRRGAFVGSMSGAVSVAAHALGGGAVSPSTSSAALLIVVCTAAGVLVAVRRTRAGLGEVMAMLAVGQTLTHVALTLSAGHQHGREAPALTLSAHLAAIPVGALLIRAAEHALLWAASETRYTANILVHGPAAPRRIFATSAVESLPGPWRRLFGSGSGLRGPPTSRCPSSYRPRTLFARSRMAPFLLIRVERILDAQINTPRSGY
ncbi:hypothetical protein AB0C34_07255 [Nocardia sp. NPDC049220]|uniref:hypothetical protein n=1 Tax=Nocardia sp. NPDC049220 TaxID=3155273 RepID=UPI0033E45B7D